MFNGIPKSRKYLLRSVENLYSLKFGRDLSELTKVVYPTVLPGGGAPGSPLSRCWSWAARRETEGRAVSCAAPTAPGNIAPAPPASPHSPARHPAAQRAARFGAQGRVRRRCHRVKARAVR